MAFRRLGRRFRQADRHHERPPDPVEASDRPLEDKAPHERPEPGPEHAPGSGEPPEGGHDPHHALNQPVGEPDPTADSDPYEPEEDEPPPA
jgi:hypothetical protein